MFFNKPASQGVTIDWHQDVGSAATRCDALRSVTIWTALDRSTVANGALQVRWRWGLILRLTPLCFPL
jgi:ectoine hydroxylase-related dioxygenase (phytanoyl-CoA dioxygenase family)